MAVTQSLLKCGFLLGWVLFFANASAKSRKERMAKQEIYVNLRSEPPMMDPQKSFDATSNFWLGHTFEGLVGIGPNGTRPLLAAQSHSVSPDGTTHTFELRPGGMWHDNVALIAEHFVYGAQFLVDPKEASEASFMAELAFIKNAKEIIRGQKTVDTLGVFAKGPRTVVFQLEKPVPYFLSILASNVFYPRRSDLQKKFQDKIYQSVATFTGNGPFKMVKWQPSATMRLEKFAPHWDAGSVRLSAIETPVITTDQGAIYNAVKTEVYDYTQLDAERTKQAALDRIPTRSVDVGCVFYDEFNVAPGRPFHGPEGLLLRKALILALDRNEIVYKLLKAPAVHPTFGLVSPSVSHPAGGLFRKVFPITHVPDLKKAKDLVAQYLKQKGQNQIPPMSLLSQSSPYAVRKSEYTQAVMQALFGNRVTVQVREFKQFLQMRGDGQFDFTNSGWCPDFDDPISYLDLYTAQSPQNDGKYNNPQYEKLIALSHKSLDLMERGRLLAQAESLLIDEDPAVIGGYAEVLHLPLPKGLNGLQFTVSGMKPNLRYAYWDHQ